MTKCVIVDILLLLDMIDVMVSDPFRPDFITAFFHR